MTKQKRTSQWKYKQGKLKGITEEEIQTPQKRQIKITFLSNQMKKRMLVEGSGKGYYLTMWVENINWYISLEVI